MEWSEIAQRDVSGPPDEYEVVVTFAVEVKGKWEDDSARSIVVDMRHPWPSERVQLSAETIRGGGDVQMDYVSPDYLKDTYNRALVQGIEMASRVAQGAVTLDELVARGGRGWAWGYTVGTQAGWPPPDEPTLPG